MKKKLRSFFANSILTSILLILLGVTFILFSEKVDEALNLIFFSALLILGGGQCIFYLRNDRKTAVDTTDLVGGLSLFLVAFFVYFRWDNISILTQYLLALLIAFNSIRLLQSSISLHSLKDDKWYLMLLFAAIGTGYGGTLLFLSFSSDTLLYRLLGGGFIYSGILNIISSIWVSVRLRQRMLEDKLAEKDGRSNTGNKKRDYPVTDLDTVD